MDQSRDVECGIPDPERGRVPLASERPRHRHGQPVPTVPRVHGRLNKRYTNRWQAQISYVFAKATGNVDNTSAAQVATRQFETPNLALVNAEGDASYTPTHEFKLLGSYQIPKIETTVSGVLPGDERPTVQLGSSSSPAAL